MHERSLFQRLPCSPCVRSEEICGSQRTPTWKIWIEEELVKPKKKKEKSLCWRRNRRKWASLSMKINELEHWNEKVSEINVCYQHIVYGSLVIMIIALNTEGLLWARYLCIDLGV